MIRRPPRSTRTDTFVPHTTLVRSRTEEAHLHAAVVEVVLAVHDVAGPLQDAAQRVAVGGPAPTAGVQRPRWVGRHELDVDLAPAPDVEPREAGLPGRHDRSEARRVGNECVRTCRSRGSPLL